MQKLTLTQAIDLIKDTDGKIFSVIFRKKNGDKRHMVCRFGVTKYVTGKGMSYDALSRGLLPVYDMQSKGYRMINTQTIEAVQVKGKVYNVV